MILTGPPRRTVRTDKATKYDKVSFVSFPKFHFTPLIYLSLSDKSIPKIHINYSL